MEGPTTDERRELERLDAEERSLSARRTRLHERIDFLRTGGGGPADEVAGLLADLEREEREVSLERRKLHERIEIVRAELLGRRPS